MARLDVINYTQNEFPTYFEINVAMNGKHLFATSPRSITSTYDLEDKLQIFIEKFPEHEGFSISISMHVEYSRIINMEDVLHNINKKIGGVL